MPVVRKTRPRVAIIGLDCAEPSLVFDQYADAMPTLTALRQRGIYGPLESVIPAITVPAWSCLTSGRDPGALGIYGFRNRRDRSYSGLTVANRTTVRLPRLWDILSQQGRRSVVLNVPGTYPPPPLTGALIGCFLTPNADCAFTHPPELQGTLADWLNGQPYPFDVKDFRTTDKTRVLADLYTMTQTHFDVARRLAAGGDWDLFMTVEIGVDRIHHLFWSAIDALHRDHDPASPFKDAIRDYYAFVDARIAELLAVFPADTHVFIVSDHGAKRMDGGICLNEWLIREGYLVLAEPPPPGQIVRFDALNVDWTRTRVWGEGGYYGRVFLNVEGRELFGCVPLPAVPALLAELTAKFTALGDENGQLIGTNCFQPAEIYPTVAGIPPDLLVYFGDLAWRAVGTVGWGTIHIHENDTGPDDANHAQYGIFIYADPQRDHGGERRDDLHLLQIAPTVLQCLGLPIPAEMQRGPIAL